MEKTIFQKKINFTDDVKTNYCGDLFSLFYDTLGLIKPFNKVNNNEEYISASIVLLQTIFVHQDLMDELLYMKQNINNDKECYASYNYLQKIVYNS